MLGDTPNHMDGLTLQILLQYQDTRSLRIVRISFNHYRLWCTRNNISGENVIFRQFVITMTGYADFTATD